MRRKIRPLPNHALLFPNKKGNEKVIFDKEVSLWIWSREPFKHIQLKDFPITLSFAHNSINPPLKTSENLTCFADVFYRIEVSKKQMN